MAVHDVVKYILNQTGPIPAMTLQKLVSTARLGPWFERIDHSFGMKLRRG